MPPEYKRAGQIVKDDRSHLKRRGFGFRHGPIAAVLLVMSVVIGFGIPFVTVVTLKRELVNETLIACLVAGVVFWLWGCVHLTLHLRLNLLWSLCGLLSIVGLGILFWAGGRGPKWKRENIAAQDRHDRQVKFQNRDGPY